MASVSPEGRSHIMSRIRSRDTKPELRVRSVAHALGLRFRLGGCGLPGRPDLVLRRRGAVIFVHGCFWHQHTCKLGKTPSNNLTYWFPKLAKNKARDIRTVAEMKALGWRVLVVWECETADSHALRARLVKFFELNEPSGRDRR